MTLILEIWRYIEYNELLYLHVGRQLVNVSTSILKDDFGCVEGNVFVRIDRYDHIADICLQERKDTINECDESKMKDSHNL